MKMSYKLFCLVAFLSIATFSGCSHVTKNDLSKPISATDSRGKVIKLNDVAKRVVVLFPSLLDEVYMLQAGDQVVGIPQQVYQMEDTYAFYRNLIRGLPPKHCQPQLMVGSPVMSRVLLRYNLIW
ncbi:hypothetical protein [Sphingobacterium sp. IITKGP-BTPF85]|uniref:hypothetical protein n=1 Tax=Sphingobacterium sp. IITKGP-BTPF85 TaxID=1338009 RepID=UPI00062F79A6|nr:hypothetical protein [Sphingobacterium sp. IITKGP-BTPF85]KKX50738.1 hypothetical protein L950_0208560 [Sphingobacterium sp. IITKGP-BTPF85]